MALCVGSSVLLIVLSPVPITLPDAETHTAHCVNDVSCSFFFSPNLKRVEQHWIPKSWTQLLHIRLQSIHTAKNPKINCTDQSSRASLCSTVKPLHHPRVYFLTVHLPIEEKTPSWNRKFYNQPFDSWRTFCQNPKKKKYTQSSTQLGKYFLSYLFGTWTLTFVFDKR